MSAFAVAFLLPSFGRSRYNPIRVKCAQQLRAIGSMIPLYAGENRGVMPPDFTTLLWTQDIPPTVAICPSSNDTPSAATQPTDLRADFVAGGHCSYVYVDGYAKYSTLAPTDVVAFEPLANHGDGANALFGDMHVEFVSKAIAMSIQKQFDAHVRPIVAR